MRMLRDNLLIKVLPRKSKSAIAMPNNFKEDWYRGEVLLVGPTVGLFELHKFSEELGQITEDDVNQKIKVGDVVIFPPCYRGTWPTILTDDNEEAIILPERDVWAVE